MSKRHVIPLTILTEVLFKYFFFLFFPFISTFSTLILSVVSYISRGQKYFGNYLLLVNAIILSPSNKRSGVSNSIVYGVIGFEITMVNFISSFVKLNLHSCFSYGNFGFFEELIYRPYKVYTYSVLSITCFICAAHMFNLVRVP